MPEPGHDCAVSIVLVDGRMRWRCRDVIRWRCRDVIRWRCCCRFVIYRWYPQQLDRVYHRTFVFIVDRRGAAGWYFLIAGCRVAFPVSLFHHHCHCLDCSYRLSPTAVSAFRSPCIAKPSRVHYLTKNRVSTGMPLVPQETSSHSSARCASPFSRPSMPDFDNRLLHLHTSPTSTLPTLCARAWFACTPRFDRACSTKQLIALHIIETISYTLQSLFNYTNADLTIEPYLPQNIQL